MNEQRAKEAYKQVNEIMGAMDKEARDRRRVPLWRTFAAAVGWKKPKAKWLAWWELRHAACMRIARKKVARSIA